MLSNLSPTRLLASNTPQRTDLYTCLLSYSPLEEFVCGFKTATFSFYLAYFRRVIVWFITLERSQHGKRKKEKKKRKKSHH